MDNAHSLFRSGANHPIRTYFGRQQPIEAEQSESWLTGEDARQFFSFYVCCFVATLLYIV